MRTHSSSNLIVESFTILKRRNRRCSKQIVEPELRTIVETSVATMPDTRTMSELFQAPTEGYKDAIVIPPILAENFELKVGLLSLVTSSQFHGFERDDPHSHIRWFNKITSTLKYKNVPHNAIKLMLFPFSLEGAARIWLEKEPPRSIHTWEDLVPKFVNYFFPHSKTTNLKNNITNFQKKFDETFSEAWDRFKDLLRKYPHHGFSELHQIDTFYNALTQSDQDSLNAAADGNLLNRTPRDALTIIENKSKVRTSQNKLIVSKVNTTTSSSSPSLDITALTDIVKELVLMNKANQQAFVKAIKETCVTCGGPHMYYECLATDSNTFNASAATRTYNQGSNGYRPQGDPNYRASNQMGPPGFPLSNVQDNQNYNRYNQNQRNYQASNNQGIGQNFNQGNNNYQAPNYQALVGPSNELTYYMKTNPRGDVKAVTTRSGVSYDEPTIPPIPSSFPKEVEREIEATKDKVQATSSKRLESRMALADLGASINLMPLYVRMKLSLLDLTPTRMTLELATRSFAYLAGIAEDVFAQVGKFTFPANFVVLDYDVDPHVPLILGRPFLGTARALVDIHREELILRDGDEKLIFHADSTPKHPHKHGNESINMINLLTSHARIVFPNLTPFKTSDSILEEFTDELALLDPFPPRNKDENFDFKADLRKIEYLPNQDPSTESNIEIIDPILENDSTLPEESSEIDTLSSSSFGNKDK
nr:reverse transcriptase domain-containing protein [Tanacetum cinerariifolium]